MSENVLNLSQHVSNLWAAKFAKILCSAVFLSGRDFDEALQNSVLGHDFLKGCSREVFPVLEYNENEKFVTISFNNSLPRTAKYYGDQGSITYPLDSKQIFYEPKKVDSNLPDPDKQDWPMGDVLNNEETLSNVDNKKLQKAVKTVFSDPEAYTTAFIAVHKGQIIAEKYGLGMGRDAQRESWSMGKSITATLIGVLIERGCFDLYDPAPVPLWSINNDDPRSKIRIADLLRMSSGLKFSGATDSPSTWVNEFPDHEYVYSGSVDVFEFSINRPLEYPPNTVGRYRNCDPLTLGYIIKKIAYESGEDYLSWPQRNLFNRIGIRKQVLETDPYGNFIMTGFDYGTPRNWARLGLLYQQRGVWMDKRIISEDFVSFVSSPAPAWEKPEYGGQFWVNGTGRWDLPKEAFFMAGIGGQWVIIDPEHELVIVRMGHRRGGKVGEYTLNKALPILVDAIKS
jgi:CubicO group peptidase (beta-lactamase class C family)